MPGKSKHGKRKHFHTSKKSKQIMRHDTAASVTPAPKAAAVPKPTAPTPTVPAQKAASPLATAKAEQYAYVPGDLRRIGLLALTVLIILFAVYFALG